MLYIIKVRDRKRAEARFIMTDFAYRVTEWNKWQTWVGAFKTPEEAMAQIVRQKSRPTRFSACAYRDYRVFAKDGRKLTLVAEIIEEA